MNVLPWAYAPRPDTRISTVRLGVWLFLASEAMFFGSLFSAYVLLRTGAHAWPDATSLGAARALLIPTIMLLLATRSVRNQLGLTAVFGVLFLLAKLLAFARLLDHGQHPASNLLIACWFVMSGLHWLHVAGGVGATVWVMQSKRTVTAPHHAERLHGLWLYWCFIDVVWLVILVSFYFI